MHQEIAQTLALRALSWLMGDDIHRDAFLAQSGADAAALRAGARDLVFLGFVLDFILQSDDRIVDFCDAEGLEYDAPALARAALPGAADLHG
ncbi:MAG: DUF3572 family protein [Pseudomonadota bacterium]